MNHHPYRFQIARRLIQFFYSAGVLMIILGLVLTSTTTSANAKQAATPTTVVRLDKSSLVFDDSFGCQGDCQQVRARVCNHGDEAMTGTSTWELYYAASGNPKDGTIAASGTIQALAVNACQVLTFDPSLSGNYMFKAYQRPGHPGTGVLWSEQCSVSCSIATSQPTATTQPTATQQPTNTAIPTQDPTDLPTATATAVSEPTATQVPTQDQEATATAIPTATSIPTEEATSTSVPTEEPTVQPTEQIVVEATATQVIIETAEPETPEPEPTATFTPVAPTEETPVAATAEPTETVPQPTATQPAALPTETLLPPPGATPTPGTETGTQPTVVPPPAEPPATLPAPPASGGLLIPVTGAEHSPAPAANIPGMLFNLGVIALGLALIGHGLLLRLAAARG